MPLHFNMSKTFSNNRLRCTTMKKAEKYARKYKGSIGTESVTWAGTNEYIAVWNILVLKNHKGRIIAEVRGEE